MQNPRIFQHQGTIIDKRIPRHLHGRAQRCGSAAILLHGFHGHLRTGSGGINLVIFCRVENDFPRGEGPFYLYLIARPRIGKDKIRSGKLGLPTKMAGTPGLVFSRSIPDGIFLIGRKR